MLANDAQLAAEVNGAKATSTDDLEKPAIMTISNEEDEGELQATIDDEINNLKSLKKKKEVPVVDWSKGELVPFDKKFYKESADVQGLTKEEVTKILEKFRRRGCVGSWLTLGICTSRWL
jgi:ATP-dependent RNA helicase DDX46/PRP5